MNLPDAAEIWRRIREKPVGVLVGCILALLAAVIIGASNQLGEHYTKKILESEKSPPGGERTAKPGQPSAAPKPVAEAGPRVGQSAPPATPVAPPQVAGTAATPPAPSGSAAGVRAPLCAHITLPLKPSSIVSTNDRVCAIAACTSIPSDAPSLAAMREWIALAKTSRPCDLADREALGDYDFFKKLLALAGTQSTATGASKPGCLDIRQALIDDISAANAALAADEKATQRCGGKVQKSISPAVQALLNNLR